MSQPFNISMSIRADASQAKGTLEDFRRQVQRTSVETEKAKSALDAEAVALDKVVQGAAKAAAAKKGLAAVESGAASSALTHAIQQAAGTARLSIDATATAAQAARTPIEGFTGSLSGLTAAMLREVEASRLHRAALDDIRASYNPLFAASLQYERTLQQIGAAEKQTAISAREAAAARQLALSKIAPMVRLDAGRVGFSDAYQTNTALLSAAVAGTTARTAELTRELGGMASAAAVSGNALQAGFAGAARDAVEAAAEARNYRAALDDIRASYNPLFAVSRQYEQDLDRIAEAERMGAISAREAAAARQQAAARMAPVGATGARPVTGGAPGAWITGNLAAQGNDVMMMAMAGQNPLQLALQQGTQISQVLNGLEKCTTITAALRAGFISMLNPVSLLTIGVIALGAVGIQSLSGLIPKTKTLSEAVGDLTSSVDRYKSAMDQLRSADLSATFGSATGAARELLVELAKIERRTLTLNAKEGMGAISDSLKDSWLKSATDFGAAPTFMKTFQVGRWDSAGIEKAAAVQAAAQAAVKASGIDEQIAALQKLVDLWGVAAEHSGNVTKEENEQARLINETLSALIKTRALDENAAGKSAAKQMADDLGRQAAMAATVAKFRQDSAAVRMLELQQQRQITAAKLEALGIDAKAPEYQRIMSAMQVAHDKREQSIRDGLTRAHNEQLAALALEARLIGATTAERLRAKAVAEAQMEADRNSLSPLERALEITRAIARATAEAANARAKAVYDLQTTLMTDVLDAQIGVARDPLTKADLEWQREYTRQIRDSVDAKTAEGRADAVRARSLTEAINQQRGQIATLSDEVSVRQQVAAQVASGTLLASEANAAMQRELTLRPLVAAAARAEGVEKAQLTEIITGLRIAYEAQAVEDRRQAQNEYLRGTAERIQQARLELALIGQTAAVRSRVVALVQAERDIRSQGLTGAAADYTRRQAEDLAVLNLRIESQADAWRRVQSAGEASIDAVLDKLKGGDLTGAFANLLDELNKGFFELAVKNPLKNMLLGTNLGTIDDVGGLSGIWDRLTGNTPLDQKSVIGAASTQVQAMQIAATQVTITAATLGLGGGAAGLLAGLPGAGGLGGAANVNAAPLTDKSGVAAQIWNFFSAKGLAPHQVAAVVGHAKAESGFNPLAIGDNGNAAGLWQHNGPRMQGLLGAIGGRAGLGNVQAQMEQVWREFMTTESAAYRRLSSAPDLRSATWAMQGFERPSGYDRNVVGSGMHWEKRLAGAEQALATFGTTTQQATAPINQMGQTVQTTTARVDQMGEGMGQFGGALQQILGAAVTGNKGGALGGLLNLGLGLLTKGLGGGAAAAAPAAGFMTGGPTGGSDPTRVAGVVHEQEYVFSAASVRKIGARNLDALHRGSLRGFASGGFVGPSPMPAAAGGGGGASGGGSVTFAPSFDLRGANDPAEVERAARRGMQAALDDYDRQRLPGRLREALADRRAM